MQKLKNVILKTNSVDEFKLKCSRIFLYLCVLFFAVTIIFNVSYSVAPVSGLSMYPTINDSYVYGDSDSQDRVVLNYIKNYKRGDIIVAKKTYEADGEAYIYVIKRLIAVGGDRLTFDISGNIYINGELLVEDYVNSNKAGLYNKIQNLKAVKPEFFEGEELVIPKNYVFYLGDNRGASTDCSNFGPVKSNEIVAKADFLIRSGENFFLSILKQIFNGGRLW